MLSAVLFVACGCASVNHQRLQDKHQRRANVCVDRYNLAVEELAQVLSEYAEDLEQRSRDGDVARAAADRLYRRAKQRMGFAVQQSEIRYQECELASMDQLDAETAAREEEVSVRNFRNSLLALESLEGLRR
jgi:hypothetical protein